MKKLFALIIAIASLVVLLQPQQVSIGQEDEPEFVGVTKCKLCHNRRSTGKFLDNWEESVHAKAFDLLNDEEKKNPECLKCHTTGYGKPGGFVSLEETPKMTSVQCEMCHGPAEKHVKSKKDDVIPSPWKPEAKRCETCHQEEGNPNWDPEKYTKPDGTKTGFYYEEAVKKVNHSAILEDKK